MRVMPLLLLGTALAVGAAREAPCAAGEDALAAENAASSSAPSQAMTRRIDAVLAEQGAAAGVPPVPLAGDAEFLRRASLDLTGVVPRVSAVHEFLADADPDKRARLIDRLLASSGYATHLATVWRNRILPHGAEPARAREAAALHKWLRIRFAKNLRYDNLVGGLLLTNGGDELGPALYFQTHEVAPEKIAASAAELFLGVKLHCAQCHDHPYADWSQREFWGFAAFFARVKGPEGMGMRTDYRLTDLATGEVRLPGSDEVVAPKFPRGAAADGESPSATRRTQVVLWLTSRDNRFFARAAVNWAWEHLFGRPLVAALDGIDEQEPTWNVQLLDELADGFVRSGFDLQQLWRALANTQAYQRSAHRGEETPPEVFARMLPKPLTPEQLYDSFALLAPGLADGAALTPAALGAEGASGLQEDPRRAEFVRRMRPPPGEPTAYRAGTLQALLMMNGGAMAATTGGESSGVLGALEAPFMTDDERIDALFLATLARRPSSDERRLFTEALAECPTPADRRQAFSDALWALLNSTEFAFNH